MSLTFADWRKVHDAKNNEAHGAMKKERHVCARRRVGEPAVSYILMFVGRRQAGEERCLREREVS